MGYNMFIPTGPKGAFLKIGLYSRITATNSATALPLLFKPQPFRGKLRGNCRGGSKTISG